MARPERPVPGEGPLADLARELRRIREQASNPGYRELAAKASFSRETLAAAARGEECPTWEVVKAFADACDPTGAATRRLRSLWQKASPTGSNGRRRRSSSRRSPVAADKPAPASRPSLADPPRPDPAGTAAEYAYQLRALRAWAGNLGYKELLSWHGRRRLTMGRTAFYEVLSPQRTTLPRLDLVRQLLAVYLDDNAEVNEWVSAWRAISHREFTEANPRPAGQPGTGTRATLRIAAG
jgi:hypothetical protein